MKIRTFLNLNFIILGIIIELLLLYITKDQEFYFYSITFIISMVLLGKIKYLPLTDNSAMPVLFVGICYTILLLIFNINQIRLVDIL